MKKRLLIWFSILLGMLLAACAPAAAPPAESALPETEIETVSESSSSTDSDSAAAPVANVDTTDLTLIGNTGRPQFLNAYASW